MPVGQERQCDLVRQVRKAGPGKQVKLAGLSWVSSDEPNYMYRRTCSDQLVRRSDDLSANRSRTTKRSIQQQSGRPLNDGIQLISHHGKDLTKKPEFSLFLFLLGWHNEFAKGLCDK